MTPDALSLTGERTLPGIAHENYWFARHVAAYRFAASRCRGLRVLDAGCGEGYGAALLASTAAHVIGAELDATVVAHAGATYPQVEFVECDLTAIPLPDASVDAVTSFQVVEHLPELDHALAESARVLRTGGELLCATPNRLTFPPGNPFHVEELTAAELADRLAPHFRVKAILGVHHGPRLRTLERVLRRSMYDLLLAAEPDDWPRWLRTVVGRVRAEDFVLRADDVDDSLDLLAIAAKR